MTYLVNEHLIIEEQKRIRRDIVAQYIKVRKEKHLTQEQFAKTMNITRPNISRFESGEYNPTIDMLVKMAKYLDMELVIELRENKEK